MRVPYMGVGWLAIKSRCVTVIETKILQDIIGDGRHRGGMILVLIE